MDDASKGIKFFTLTHLKEEILIIEDVASSSHSIINTPFPWYDKDINVECHYSDEDYIKKTLKDIIYFKK